MNVARIISLVHLGLAVYGLLTGNVLLFVLNMLCFGIMDNNARLDNLTQRVNELDGTNAKNKTES